MTDRPREQEMVALGRTMLAVLKIMDYGYSVRFHPDGGDARVELWDPEDHLEAIHIAVDPRGLAGYLEHFAETMPTSRRFSDLVDRLSARRGIPRLSWDPFSDRVLGGILEPEDDDDG